MGMERREEWGWGGGRNGDGEEGGMGMGGIAMGRGGRN